MKIKPVKLPNGEFDVTQPNINGWETSFNPDDTRWYVHHPVTNDTMATFAERRNAVQWANSHRVEDYPDGAKRRII